jgi:hypothetical protein
MDNGEDLFQGGTKENIISPDIIPTMVNSIEDKLSCIGV